MKIITLSVLLAAGAAFAGAAHAQTGHDTPYAPYTASQSQRADTPSGGLFQQGDPGPAVLVSHNPYEAGFTALEAGKLQQAEKIFSNILNRSPRSGEANFYLGSTRMDLGKWEDAKRNLQVAVRKIPRHPDPKARLGVTYAKLGDATGALAQRADLVKMAEACNGTCEFSSYIAEGIAMIDEALAGKN